MWTSRKSKVAILVCGVNVAFDNAWINQLHFTATYFFWWSLTRFLRTVIYKTENHVWINLGESLLYNFASFSCQSNCISGNLPICILPSLCWVWLLVIDSCMRHQNVIVFPSNILLCWSYKTALCGSLTSYFWYMYLYCSSNFSASSWRIHFQSSFAVSLHENPYENMINQSMNAKQQPVASCHSAC